MADEAEQESLKLIRILLVEDHLLTRIGLKTIIERQADLRIIAEAENGKIAVEKAIELNPDVVLMDVGMPVMDGIVASKQIKEKLPDIHIIMLTSHDNEQDIFASLTAGASGYCLKDVAPERLYTAIRSVYSGDIWLDSAIASKVMNRFISHSQVKQSSTAAIENSKAQPGSQLPLPEPLSPRELEVLTLLVEGLSNQQIADKLYISLATSKTHVRNILNKLTVDDRTQAAVSAMRRGLV